MSASSSLSENKTQLMIAKLMKALSARQQVLAEMKQRQKEERELFRAKIAQLRQDIHSANLKADVVNYIKYTIQMMFKENEEREKGNGMDNDIAEEDKRLLYAFKCRICLQFLQNRHPFSTACGHVFCRECIVVAIRVRGRCPICCRRISHSQIHPVYF